MGYWLPPEPFDHPPSIPVIERVMDFRSIDTTCQKMVGAYAGYYTGCSVIHDGKCYVWRIDNNDVKRHEYAHCNGWVHPNPVVSTSRDSFSR